MGASIVMPSSYIVSNSSLMETVPKPNSSQLSAKEAAEQLAAATQAEVIQCIGRKLVLYREKEEE